MSENETLLRPLDIVPEDEKEASENYDIFHDDGTLRSELKTAVSLTLECQQRNRLLLSTKLAGPKRKRASTTQIDSSREPSQSFLLTYSAANIKNKLEMEISPQIVSALQASTKQVPRRPSVRRTTAASLQSDKSAGPKDEKIASSKASKKKKKVRFADNVTIHRISVHRDSAPPEPETFIMIIELREIWKKLDLDRDKHLNRSELKRFADKVWENEDAETMIYSYAAHPEKGLCFGEWCAVLKEEEGDMDELIDELYTIFVEEPDWADEEDDEKESVLFVN